MGFSNPCLQIVLYALHWEVLSHRVGPIEIQLLLKRSDCYFGPTSDHLCSSLSLRLLDGFILIVSNHLLLRIPCNCGLALFFCYTSVIRIRYDIENTAQCYCSAQVQNIIYIDTS